MLGSRKVSDDGRDDWLESELGDTMFMGHVLSFIRAVKQQDGQLNFDHRRQHRGRIGNKDAFASKR